MNASERPRVAIACQGGGSHTAFTAGVLKGLLGSLARTSGNGPAAVNVVALSGTSGGGLCAALAWAGLVRDDPALGVKLLEKFWKDNAARDPCAAFWNQWTQAMLRLRGVVAMPDITPYALPACGQEQLRGMLEDLLNFAELRQRARQREEPELLVGAVEVQSGRFEVFGGRDLRVECLLASTAMPDLFPAVEVPGRGTFWDGLFSQNPPIRELTDYRLDELWVVQINSSTCRTVPVTVDDIADRRNELSGNLSLEQELRFVEKINEFLRTGLLDRGGKYRLIQVHRIELGEDLEYASKLDRSPEFLKRLMKSGEEKARAFLKERRGAPREAWSEPAWD